MIAESGLADEDGGRIVDIAKDEKQDWASVWRHEPGRVTFCKLRCCLFGTKKGEPVSWKRNGCGYSWVLLCSGRAYCPQRGVEMSKKDSQAMSKFKFLSNNLNFD